MADLFLSPLVDAIVGKLVDAAIDEIKLVWGVKEELENLSSTLSTINAVLRDAENKQLTDEAVKDWIRKLKDVAYDADDVVDEFVYDVLQKKVEGEIPTSRLERLEKVRMCCFSCFTSNPIFFRHVMALQIKGIREKLDRIAKERNAHHLNIIHAGQQHEIRKRLPTCSVIEEPVIGRKDDREKIIKMLLAPGDSGSSDNVSVIPIVGIGGLGKTTLAQFVYNDNRIVGHFPIRIWVSVSENFDVVRLTKAVLESITNEPCQLNEIDRIQVTVKEKLTGKRFLLVLDDVWNESRSAWLRLQAPFSAGVEGSKIIVTTRSLTTSKMMGTVPEPYCLEGLPHNDGWSLFSRRAFPVRSSDVPPNLIEIGHQIVEKCKGLPLAIGALGGLLSYNMDAGKWSEILNSEIWELTKAQEDIFPILRISYDHLPIDLKRCFAYCSLFPKNCLLSKDFLTKQWIAAGFIQPDPNKLLEEISSDYFDDLMWRSFLQHSQDNKSRYVMHDLVHDLAQSICGDEFLRTENSSHQKSDDTNSCQVLEKVRHSSFILHNQDQNFEVFHGCKGLRTFIIIAAEQSFINQVPHNFFLKLRCLRMLDLYCTNVHELPDSIGNLKHLRYVNLSYTPIQRLPESISSLYHLQVLNLDYCKRLVALPKNTSSLINLRHLGLWKCNIFTPPGLGKLTSLQTLGIFVVGKEPGLGIGELKNLIHLRGKIHLSNLENVMNGKEANLKQKQHLTKLVFEWSDERDTASQERWFDENILETLQPHTNLQKLKMVSYKDITFPRWMMEENEFCKFNLMSVSLMQCMKCELLPPFGQLRFLKDLYLSGLNALKYIGRQFIGESMRKGFPLLEELHLSDMDNLEAFSGMAEGDFPRLSKFSISNCPQLREFPVFSSLRELDLHKCNEVILSMVPRLTTLTSIEIHDFETLTSIPKGLLKPLTALKRLKIDSCNELVSWPKEVGLHILPSLEELEIARCSKLESLLDAKGYPVTLTSLRVGNGCDILKSMPINGLRNLTSLQHLVLVTQLASFPRKALPLPMTLRYLEIFRCNNLKTLPKGMLYKLTSLHVLKIIDCLQLEALTKKEEGITSTLTELWIHNCNNLKSLPMLNNLISLQILYIKGCARLNSLTTTEGLPNKLMSLRISSCDGLQSLPVLKNLTALRILQIGGCMEHERLTGNNYVPNWITTLFLDEWCCDYLHEAIQNLTYLEVLHISCQHPELFTKEEELPTKLRDLLIFDCDNLEYLPKEMKKKLPSLTKLEIMGCHQLELSTGGEELPTKLEILRVNNCASLKSLPKEMKKNTPFLQELCIKECPRLLSLPDDGLPTLLYKLEISGFPELVKQCQQGGTYWPNISHIPEIEINEQATEDSDFTE